VAHHAPIESRFFDHHTRTRSRITHTTHTPQFLLSWLLMWFVVADVRVVAAFLNFAAAELLLAFVLPQDYPPAPARVSAVLSSRGSSESAGEPLVSTAASTQPEPSDELYSTSVTSMLQEQVTTRHTTQDTHGTRHDTTRHTP